MSAGKYLAIGLWAALNTAAPAADSTLDVLRVYDFHPAEFDYRLTAVTGLEGPKPLLAFNHRGGRTFFVHVGEALGSYRVKSFQAVTAQVFNASIHAYQARKSGIAALEAPNGATVTLAQGQRLPLPGYGATLVSLASGAGWKIQEQDRVQLGDLALTIDSVEEELGCVLIVTNGAVQFISMISEEEKQKLLALWQERRRQKEERLQLARQPQKEEPKEEPQEEAEAAARNPVVFERSEPRVSFSQTGIEPFFRSSTFYGTENLYPVEYQVIPGLISTSGQQVAPTLVLPVRFGPYRSGFKIEYHY